MVLAGTLLGLIYIIFSDGFGAVYPFVNGGVAGMLSGLIVAILELNYFPKVNKKRKFYLVLLIRTTTYFVLLTLVILAVVITSRMIRLDQGLTGVLVDPEFHEYLLKGDFPIAVIYTIVLALTINFTMMMSRKLGQGMLFNFVTGRYRKPVEEERIIMFMKVKNSDKFIEKLGDLHFYQFLNDFFDDITDSILSCKAIIYEYVDDLIVITWDMRRGLEDGRCIRAYFSATEDLELRKGEYFKEYGLIPFPYAAVHCGKVVRAEIGDVKSEIAFLGDTMNTTARILEKCVELQSSLLVSSTLAEHLRLPLIYNKSSKGSLFLRGKSDEIELFEIRDVVPVNVL